MNPADVYLEAVNVSFMENDEKGPHLKTLMDAWDNSDQKQVCPPYDSSATSFAKQFCASVSDTNPNLEIDLLLV